MGVLARKLMVADEPLGPVAISYVTQSTGALSSGARTASSISIGAAADDRIIAVLVGGENSQYYPSSVTIDYGTGAQTMTPVVGVAHSVNAGPCVGAFYLAVPTGTTATFVITYNNGAATGSASLVVYSVTGAAYKSSGSDETSDFDATDPTTTGSITIPSDGGIVLAAFGSTDTSAITWSNATNNLDVDAGSYRVSSANMTTSGSVTITAASTNNSSRGIMGWIMFDPG